MREKRKTCRLVPDTLKKICGAAHRTGPGTKVWPSFAATVEDFESNISSLERVKGIEPSS
jgi:hypothetical protein